MNFMKCNALFRSSHLQSKSLSKTYQMDAEFTDALGYTSIGFTFTIVKVG